jgi:hypothetical protein
VIVATPVVLSAMLFARLPETRGLELEELAPKKMLDNIKATTAATAGPPRER